MLKHIVEEIWKAGDVKAACIPLDKFIGAIEGIIEKKDLRFDEAFETAVCLTHLRYLMSQLGLTNDEKKENEECFKRLADLKSLCGELEGKVKEIRNDLYREKNLRS